MVDPAVHFVAASDVYPLWVVILNWNLPDDTLACIESVLAGLPPQTNGQIPVQILVVDNGSSDDSVARLRRAFRVGEPGARVHLLETGRNLGFAGGMNVGAAHALAQGARSVLLLNNDTLIDPAMLSHLAAALASDGRAGLAGPVIYYLDEPSRIWRFGDNEHPWLPIPRRIPDALVSAAPATPRVVDYITACAMLVRKEVFEQVGFLDDRFFMYFEDADYCRRVREAGFTILGVPHAKMWHKVSVSAKKAKASTYYAGTWARVRFYRMHPHGKLPWLIHPYLWGRALVAGVKHLLAGEWDLLKPLWRGTLDGYRADTVRVR